MSVRNFVIDQIRVITLFAGALLMAVAAHPTLAQETVVNASFNSSSKEPILVNVLAGQSCLVIFDQPIGRLAVSNTETAEVVVVAPNQMMVNGKASGRARFTTWVRDGDKFVFFDVDVRSNLAQIDSQVRALFPKEDIRLSQANGSVVISGNVDPKVAKQVETVVQAAGFKTVNLFSQPIQAVPQVQLQLRLAEVSRNKLSEIAVSPAALTSSGRGGYFNTGQGPFTPTNITNDSIMGSIANNLNLFIMSNGVMTYLRALQQQGALRALAEPNLVAMDGQQASFLAGGELPIPVFQGGGGGGTAVTIQYKEYGVRVNFKPTILDEQHIRLEIEPEVSTLDYNNAVRFNGFLIPALRTRRAKTGIELRDGQSFGIAGLIDNNESKSLAKLPIISSVPILGNLFKSKSFQKSESELVFIVTAKITEPLNPDAIPNMKGIDGLKGSSPLGVEAPSPQNNNNSPGGATSFVNTIVTPASAPAPNPTGGTVPNSTAPASPPKAPTPSAGSGSGAGSGGASSVADRDDAPINSGSPVNNATNKEETPAGNDSKNSSSEPAGKAPQTSKDPQDSAPTGEPAGEKAAPQKPAEAKPPQKMISQHPAEGTGWKIKVPPSPALTAQNAKDKPK